MQGITFDYALLHAFILGRLQKIPMLKYLFLNKIAFLRKQNLKASSPSH